VFDADDTLWHNERLYNHTQAGLEALLAPYGVEPEAVEAALFATETRNIGLFGYGVKSFALSMIETAIELTGGKFSGPDVLSVIALAKAQITAPMEPLEHVVKTVAHLATRYHLMVITKGDLLDQEAKMARSGLGSYFKDIEVVSDKTPEKYARLFKNHNVEPARVLMVGDSLRSDILPILEIGAMAVYIPYEIAWQHEAAQLPAADSAGFYQLKNISELPALLDRLDA
jgi:putative hydrolase of the HAD superfamily